MENWPIYLNNLTLDLMQNYELSEKREYSSICQLWDDDDLRFGVEEETNILVYDRIKCNKLH